MPIFAIALLPGGNVVSQVRRIASFSFSPAGVAAARALPEGIYLGFYGEGASGDEGFVRSFNRGAGALFAALPPLLVFRRAKRSEEKWYLVPDPAFSPDLQAAADAIALEAGRPPLKSPPLLPGEGFFAGNDVTLPPFGAFSFRHLDAVLYRLESGGPTSVSLRWTVLSRIARRTGPRKTGPK